MRVVVYLSISWGKKRVLGVVGVYTESEIWCLSL